MTNNKEIRRVVILIVAAILALVCVCISVYNDNYMQVSLGEEYSFEDDYNLYIEYADDYVKTWNESFLKDKNVTINSEINNRFVKITVEGEFSKIEARYPMKVELNEEKSETIISYESGTYEKSKNTLSEFDARLVIVFIFLLVAVENYILISVIVWIVTEIIKIIKEKIYQNMKQKEENNNEIIDNNK